MDEKQKPYAIRYNAKIDLARQAEAVNGNSEA
jgi:hypothetical protein